jgi:hypothetical protein
MADELTRGTALEKAMTYAAQAESYITNHRTGTQLNWESVSACAALSSAFRELIPHLPDGGTPRKK